LPVILNIAPKAGHEYTGENRPTRVEGRRNINLTRHQEQFLELVSASKEQTLHLFFFWIRQAEN